mgnify:CR=1 FL=1
MSADEEFIDGQIRFEAGRVLVHLERLLESTAVRRKSRGDR